MSEETLEYYREPLYWHTANGQRLSISYMNTGHIKNCLRGIEDGRFCKNNTRRDLYLSEFKRELKSRVWWRRVLKRICK